MIDLQEATLDGVTVVRMTGRLDGETSASADAWLRALMARDASSLVLDLSALTFVSSAGLRVVLGAAKTCGARGGELRLAGMSSQVHKVFDIAGFLRYMKTDDTAAVAVAAINAARS